MKRWFAPAAFGALAFFPASPSQAVDTVPNGVIRHLVYNFTVGIRSSTVVHDSGIGSTERVASVSGSGISDYKGRTSDQGTITVDVTGASADGGLVVSVSENARNSRSAKPATCVVFGATLSTICSNELMNDEEIAIVRLVGRDFVAQTMLAPQSHWSIPANLQDGTETNDFTVTGVQNGVLAITEQRVDKVRGANSFDATTNGTIAYNAALSVPTALHEVNVRRENGGPQNQSTIETYTDLALVTDTMAAKP